MTVTRQDCGACGIRLDGQFAVPRLARLSPEDQRLIEAFLLADGSLKALAKHLSVSYPTVRKRLDALIERLNQLRRDDEQQNNRLLEAVERGRMTAEKAARLMTESTYG